MEINKENKILTKVETGFGWRRNLEFVKEIIIIQIKSLNEYKINFYLSLLLSFVFTTTISIFLYVLFQNFNSLINWNFNEFFFFVNFDAIFMIFFGMFWFNSNLPSILISGNLNIKITKPLPIFWQHFFSSSNIFSALTIIPYLIIIFYFLFFILVDFSILKLIIVSIFGFFSGITYTLIIRMFESSSFFIKRSNIFSQIFLPISGIFDRFPANIFNDKIIKSISLIFPNVYSGVFSTQYFFGIISFNQLLIYFSYLLLIILICSVIIWLNWHYGLKKYEAFG